MIVASYRGDASTVAGILPAAHFDLVLTSPPAYPSPKQAGTALGKEPTVGAYVANLSRVLFQCRHLMKPDAHLVLVIEPLPGHDVLGALRTRIRRIWRCLATYHWSHGDGTGSWVIFLGRGNARLNREYPAWRSMEWAIPRPPADPAYGFYEWPVELVQAIVGLTIPNGGTVLDPFAGKARALAALPDKYAVTTVDVMPL